MILFTFLHCFNEISSYISSILHFEGVIDLYFLLVHEIFFSDVTEDEAE